MSIHSISAGTPALQGGASGSKEESQIKTLEQKLLQLNKEKDKAKKSKDMDKVRELEQKIQKLERQLEELRNRKNGKEDETAQARPSASPDDMGNYVDEFA